MSQVVHNMPGQTALISSQNTPYRCVSLASFQNHSFLCRIKNPYPNPIVLKKKALEMKPELLFQLACEHVQPSVRMFDVHEGVSRTSFWVRNFKSPSCFLHLVCKSTRKQQQQHQRRSVHHKYSRQCYSRQRELIKEERQHRYNHSYSAVISSQCAESKFVQCFFNAVAQTA